VHLSALVPLKPNSAVFPHRREIATSHHGNYHFHGPALSRRPHRRRQYENMNAKL
jgi:hypothetical protein